jgi:hypothetical protein
MTITQQSSRSPSSRFVRLTQLPPFLFATFVTITTLAIFIPLNPDMPDKGIDQSWTLAMNEARGKAENVLSLARIDQAWVFAINEAVARHLRFGKEIIFPFGPYASIYTRSFNPATDRFMVFGSLLVGLSYAVTMLYLSRGHPYIILILMLSLATFPSRDALLLSYPFILVVCVLKRAHFDNPGEKSPLRWWQILAAMLTFSALGLLPLIKISLLVPVSVSVAILALLAYRFPLKQAIPLLCIPILATITCWVITGQSLSDLPAFLRGAMLLTSGYTSAMSTPFLGWPSMIGYGFVISYLVVSALIYLSLIRSTQLTVSSKWLLGLLCAWFLLVAFKHGFVRGDHEAIAFNSLLIFLLTIRCLYTDKYLVGSLLFISVIVVGIYCRHDPILVREVREKFGVGTVAGGSHRKQLLAFISEKATGVVSRSTYESTLDTYMTAWEGLHLRLTDSKGLQARFVGAMADIRSEYAVPALKGTTDIYTYEQSVLLASTNEWSPRPIFQSYSAYTAALARLNEQHLRGANAPDWVLFDLLAIDARLPSMEDGLSWPAILDNYTFVSFDGEFVLLRKNAVTEIKSDLDALYTQSCKTGGIVGLPEMREPLYAEIDLRPTWMGKLLIALFKPPQVNIVLNLRNGDTFSYGTVPEILRTGFILSPLVRTTEQFAALAAGNRRFLDESQVGSILIAPSYGGRFVWSDTYTLTLKTYHGPPTGGSDEAVVGAAR